MAFPDAISGTASATPCGGDANPSIPTPDFLGEPSGQAPGDAPCTSEVSDGHSFSEAGRGDNEAHFMTSKLESAQCVVDALAIFRGLRRLDRCGEVDTLFDVLDRTAENCLTCSETVTNLLVRFDQLNEAPNDLVTTALVHVPSLRRLVRQFWLHRAVVRDLGYVARNYPGPLLEERAVVRANGDLRPWHSLVPHHMMERHQAGVWRSRTMRITARAAGMAVAALVTGSALGACTSSSSSSSTSTSRGSTTTTSATATTGTGASTTAAPASTTVATATCQPSQLNIALFGSEGAAGTIELTFFLTNTSTMLCVMHGYPGMELLNASGGNLATVVTRGGGLTFENVAVTDVSLAPGQTAYFNLGYGDVPVGTTSCSVASQVEITPPNDTSFAVVPVPQIHACGGGALHVSPVFASTDSAATNTTAPTGVH